MTRRSKRPYKEYMATAIYRNSVNLYRFIRLILGDYITDRQIASNWHMDDKNFHEFKVGKYPVPRLEKLEQLARVLGINKHLLFQVAGGASARQVYKLIKNNDVQAQCRLLACRLDQTHQDLLSAEKRYRAVFNYAGHAILVADSTTGKIIDCNRYGEKLFGYPKNQLVGLHQSFLFPPERREFHRKNFGKYVNRIKGAVTDTLNICRADGKIVPITLTSTVIDTGDQRLVQGIFRPIKAEHIR